MDGRNKLNYLLKFYVPQADGTLKDDYCTIPDMQKAINDKQIQVINSTKLFRVNSAKSFIKLWSNPIRSKWLVNSFEHDLADFSYQFINSPIGDWRLASNHLAGKQIFVSQFDAANCGCPKFRMINQYFVYQRINVTDGTTKWIQIVNQFPAQSSEPVFKIFYRNIYELGCNAIYCIQLYVTNHIKMNCVMILDMNWCKNNNGPENL